MRKFFGSRHCPLLYRPNQPINFARQHTKQRERNQREPASAHDKTKLEVLPGLGVPTLERKLGL